MGKKRFGRLSGAFIAGPSLLLHMRQTQALPGTAMGGISVKCPGHDVDSLLDLYIPEYEVVERHHQEVAATVEIAFAVACRVDLSPSAIVRALFMLREVAFAAR